MHYCHPKVLAPIVYPTKCCIQNFHDTTIVPHIHPSHTTNVNHHLYQHNHYFPHTESVVNEVANQHFVCPGDFPGPLPGPGMMAPGMAPVAPTLPAGPTQNVVQAPGFQGNMILG